MSGHSKWHNIRLRKGAQDAKRGNLFTKLAKEITIAAKAGGGSIDTNIRLRMAVTKARESSMPADNIKRAVQRGTGEIAGEAFEEVIYEGYGPGGTAVLIECATDNKNRTVSNLRTILNKNGGRMGESGSVAYRFRPVGHFTIAKSTIEEDALFTLAIEAGAEDVRTSDTEVYEVVTEPGDFAAVRQALEDAKIKLLDSAYTMEPTDTVTLEAEDAQKMLRMIEWLEDDEDVQNVHANFDISEEIMATL
ncbi:MAG: YebC/PmpR family DNA-binding transcriptional regulator [Chthonomonadaceae bacterium]|nr:YebC/PmpR family DNA-binding transcriptional regulator [Chthonomonadaceae bacterium]